MESSKLPLKTVLAALDLNAKAAWDELTEDERKSVNFWLLNRYMSSATGSRKEVEDAVLRTNIFYNKHWNEIKPGVKGHPKLLWQLLCMSGGTGKIETHPWIGLKQKKDSNNKYVKLLLTLYPNMKYDEAELLVRISTKKELEQLIKAHGQEDLGK
jgi:hypothetical protein